MSEKTKKEKEQIEQLFSLHRDGKFKECERKCSLLLAEFPTLFPVHNLLGCARMGQNKFEQALESFNRVVELDGRYVSGHFNRGIALLRLARYEESIESLDEVIRLDPGNLEAWCSRGVACNYMNRYVDATESLQKVVDIQPENIEALDALAYAKEKMGNIDEAKALYTKVLSLNDQNFDAVINLGRVNSVLGNNEKAIELYHRSITINPNNARAYLFYSRLVKFTPEDPYILPLMEKRYKQRKLHDLGHVQLCFALSKAYEDIGRYDESFAILKEGNDLNKKISNYNILGSMQLVQYIMDVFEKGQRQYFPDEFTDGDIQPIFILGMPRSGTSLVEQIVSSHSKVHGAGELDKVRQLVYEMIFKNNQVRVFKPEERKRFHDRFLGYLRSLNSPEKIIIDKMPHNFFYIGYILSAFPRAKIIHLNRDPIAVCWSMYKRYFPASGLNFTYDLSDLAAFQQLHDKLMRFWNRQYPGLIYEINYEKLTENQEEETRNLLDYCGLEFEESCLEFHKTMRNVKTASLEQVRSQIYTGSSQSWRKFETHLQPLIEALDDSSAESIG